MIIDFHCHAGRGDLLTAPWNTAAPIEAYLRRADAPASIDRRVSSLSHRLRLQPIASSRGIVADGGRA